MPLSCTGLHALLSGSCLILQRDKKVSFFPIDSFSSIYLSIYKVKHWITRKEKEEEGRKEIDGLAVFLIDGCSSYTSFSKVQKIVRGSWRSSTLQMVAKARRKRKKGEKSKEHKNAENRGQYLLRIASSNIRDCLSSIKRKRERESSSQLRDHACMIMGLFQPKLLLLLLCKQILSRTMIHIKLARYSFFLQSR